MPAERKSLPRALRHLLLTLTAVVAAAALAAAGAAAGSATFSDIQTSFSSLVAPSRLPARRAAAVRLTLAELIESISGAHPPALQELDLGLDRNLGLSVKGVPVCHPRSSRQQREEFLSNCEEAKVGSGSMEVEIAFPEQMPVQVRGQVSVYNFGVHDGRTMFLLYTYLTAPVTGLIATPLEVRRSADGAFGWEGMLTVPKIANGVGSVTGLGFRIRKGIFSAACPAGKLRARAVAYFADGSTAASPFVQPCRTAVSG